MAQKINPFHELYITELLGEDSFVKIFSKSFVEHAMALFQPGNVVLTGLQGSGKSMLLNLLKPEIRLAYFRANDNFPVPAEFQSFIGAGINLTTSGATDFGQREISEKGRDSENLIPLYFGDFLNYWIVSDLISSFYKLATYSQGDLGEKIGIKLSLDALKKFVQVLGRDDCWFGYIGETNSLEEFQSKLSERITTYRKFFNFNIDSFSEEFINSKTRIGDPISKTVEKLIECGLISEDMKVFIKIDQYGELNALEKLYKTVTPQFQQIIHKALGNRDPSVSYRIGVRRGEWPAIPTIFGTTSNLEEERNFKIIDIDISLQRKEDKKSWIFPKFAEDIFERRLKLANLKIEGDTSNLMDKVFGKYESRDKISHYIGRKKKAPESLLKLEPEWPKPWCDFLISLSKEDLFSSWLGAAWARQRVGKEQISKPIPQEKPFPWDKVYWKKERVDQGLLQIASKNQQQLRWYGVDDILCLSGGNILIFLSICQKIWEYWLKDSKDNNLDNKEIPSIDKGIQSLGILEVSRLWNEKISENPGGDERAKFIRRLGRRLYNSLIEDTAMSYPGGNGFSFSLDDLDKNTALKDFLNTAESYGDLYGLSHTSKIRGEKRRKWYLNPILSPYYRIPCKHTKEPRYFSPQNFPAWLDSYEALTQKEKMQLNLFSK